MKRLIKFSKLWIDLDEISGAEIFDDMGIQRLKITIKSGGYFFINDVEAEDLIEILDRWSLPLDAQSNPLESHYDPAWAYSGIWEGAININQALVGIISTLISPISENQEDEADKRLLYFVDQIEAVTAKLKDQL